MRLEHEENALFPMDVTLLGMVTVVRPIHEENALFPMDVTLLGMVVVLHPITNSLVDVFMIALQLLRESYDKLPLSTLTEVRLEHQPKAELPMDVTLLGMVTEVRPEQP